ncbi:MAG: hypothetical protein ACKVP2_11910 [Burkholderiales bacterium]
MNAHAGKVLEPKRWPMYKVAAAGLLVTGMIGLIGAAAWRETHPGKSGASLQKSGPDGLQRPALTAAEETYAASLWPIHLEVKQNAVKMTFAGMAYKLGDIRQAAFRERIRPLPHLFATSLARAEKLPVPAGMRRTHGEYLQAVGLYRDAARKMLDAGEENRESEMIGAHELSTTAASLMLKVGEALWPGEYKPN